MPASESKSRFASAPLWLVVATLLGSTILTQRSNQTTGDKETTPSAQQEIVGTVSSATDSSATEDFSPAENRMLAPLREFLGLPAEATEPGKTSLAERIGNSAGSLEFLVVMVADPIETSTNYRFDLQIDALHKALGTEGYVPDHYYLPWNSPDVPNAHRTEPGVLLYRRNGPSISTCENLQARTDLLLVYLIGETPTSGIHKEAFLAAVKQMTALGEMAPCRSENSKSTIRVAGPLFTGAADSLAFGIRLARDQKLTDANFQVITGTAVSIDRRRFEDLAGDGHATLHATVLYGNILRQALIDHVLERTLSDNVRIAWLTETGTGYGSRISVTEGNHTDAKKLADESISTKPKSPRASPTSPTGFLRIFYSAIYVGDSSRDTIKIGVKGFRHP